MAAAAGCLAAPPPEASPPDELAECDPFVRNRFDDRAFWAAYAEPGASVERAPDEVRVTAAPSGGVTRAYADLHSEIQTPVADTDLTAAVMVAAPEVAIGGLSWAHDEAPGPDDDDYYDLLVDSGFLQAVHKPAFAERDVRCAPACPLYDPDRHAYLRLRAAAGQVIYQASPDRAEWTTIASAPLAAIPYRSVVFAYADAPGVTDLSVTEMAWAACDR